MMTANELRAHLAELGLTQRETAQLLGTGTRTIGNWLDDDPPGNGVPGPAEQALRAWLRLHRLGLAWRPEEEVIEHNDADAIARHRVHVLGLVDVIERVEARGGPAVTWDVDLEGGTARLGAMELNFYHLANGGFSPASYHRTDLPPDMVRDRPLLEDAYYSIAKALKKAGLPPAPALSLQTARVVEDNVVMWEDNPFSRAVLKIPVAAIRAVGGAIASAKDAEEFAERNRVALAAFVQEQLVQGRGPINGIGARVVEVDEATLAGLQLRKVPPHEVDWREPN